MTESAAALHQRLQQIRAVLDDDPDAAERSLAELATAHIADPRPNRLRASALRKLGRSGEADAAERASIDASLRLPDLDAVAQAINGGQLQQAERLVRAHLEADPEDAEALRLLAEVAARAGFHREAEAMLRNLIQAAPTYVRVYVNLATLLHPLGRGDEAIALLDAALLQEPEHPVVLSIKGSMLSAERRDEEALAAHEALLRVLPDQPIGWINYGFSLKTLGRTDEAIGAYRKALHLDPSSGAAWWGLANLKTEKLDARDAAAIERALGAASGDLNQAQLHFALGKAFGDLRQFAESFEQYSKGNALRRRLIPYDLAAEGAAVDKAEQVFTPAFLAARADAGARDEDPIFILGMPRSGSTLVEQILASHPSIEGADELPSLAETAATLGRNGMSWPDAVAGLAGDDLRPLGEAYLRSARKFRRTDRPFFTDKMPHNWRYVGLILLALPNAKIVDVRRHPMASCFANFTQYFNRQTNFASTLEDLALYYRTYVRVMAHFDRLMPGRIHRIHYEHLVADPEAEVRRLLDYLQLPFDPACLRFHDNPRPIYTPSAQQVRQPIDGARVDFWRNYEPWLEPLIRALGPVLDSYAEIPEDVGKVG